MAGADDSPYGMTHDEWVDFKEMLRLFRQRPKTDGENPGYPTDFRPRPPIVACLTEALETGETVKASVLTRKTYNNIQTIMAYGIPPTGYFKVGVQTSATAAVQWTADFHPETETPEVLQKLISDLSGVGAGNIEVTMGLVKVPDERARRNTWRWILTWCGKFAGKVLPLVQLEQHLTGAGLLVRQTIPLEPTGVFENVFCVIPVPTPTPLRAGAIVWAEWHPKLGYCVTACEVRDFGDHGIFA